MRPGSTIRRRLAALGSEEGFGIIEALVAAVMLSLAAVAIFDAYDAGTRGTYRAQQDQVELSLAQQELERIRALPYSQIALTAEPGTSTNPSDVLSRVNSGTNSFNLNRSGTPNYAELVVNGQGNVDKGTIDPGPTDVPSSDVSVKIYRFVVWQPNSGCPQPTCTGKDIKRVIVAVQPETNNPGGDRSYVELHSDFINPDATATSDIPPPGGETPGQQKFYLSDTVCDPNGPTDHNEITADHPLHNTLGDCASGQRTGRTLGAPDALLTTTPPGDLAPPWFDYQSDLEPENSPPAPNPDSDEGIQMVPQERTNPECKWMADPSLDPQREFHVWLSDEILPTAQPFELTGNVSLYFFARSLNGYQFPGKLCFWVFRRTRGGTDILFAGNATTPTWTYASKGNWPSDFGDPTDEPPTERNLVSTADIGAHKVQPTERLGLAVAVSGTQSRALELMYDHPLFPAYLSVETTTPLPPAP